ncbi:peptidoglycan glycosyltransferase, partial [Escherichia coli]|nr:peptidoglycan glycosyltransferase [Escherichia coli]
GALTDSLSRMFGKPKHYFRGNFDAQRKKGNQYYSLKRDLDFDEYDRIRKFPIFNKGKNKGGFIIDRKYKRELATAKIGS